MASVQARPHAHTHALLFCRSSLCTYQISRYLLWKQLSPALSRSTLPASAAPLMIVSSGWIRSDILTQPSDTLTVAWKIIHVSIFTFSPLFTSTVSVCLPCLITTLHMNTSIGRMPSSGTLPFPVVWYSPNWCLNSSSLTASG